MNENARSFPGKLNLGAFFISLLLTIKPTNNLFQQAQTLGVITATSKTIASYPENKCCIFLKYPFLKFCYET
jgi:hypothetical protein